MLLSFRRGFLFSAICLLAFLTMAHASSPIPFGPAKPDPRLRWRTLETEHFSIHFHQDGEELAYRVAYLAEKVHARLTESIALIPKGKTQIVINDSIDMSNGAATPILYNQIFAYPTPPVLGLGHLDDWLEFLITHEYTHILDTGHADGYTKIIQSVFGKFWFPKMFISSFFTEGYAVYNETRFTNGGRGRDPYTDMLLRKDFLADHVPELDQVMFSGIYPGNSQSYTYGGAFYQFMGERHKSDSPDTFQQRLATGLWIWGTDDAAVVSTLRPLNLLWEEWKVESKQRYLQQKEEIENQGLSSSEPLTSTDSPKWSPVWNLDGSKLYYFNANGNAHSEIRQIDLKSRKDSSLIQIHSLDDQTALTISPDGKKLAFSQIEFNRSFSVYNDLWIINLQNGKTERLTDGARVKDPDWGKHSESILGIRTEQGKTHLTRINPETKDVLTLQTEVANLTFSEPSLAPDGERFAVSVRQEGGYQDIWIFDTDGQRGFPILHDKSWDISPCWTPDGKYILFSSDRTGIYNLFAYQFDTGELHQVTNVLGGAFSPSISPDGKQIAFVNYSSNGFNIHVTDFDLTSWRDKVRLSEAFFKGYSIEGQATDETQRSQEKQSHSYRSHSYNPLSTLLPRFWIPYPGADEYGPTIGGITVGRDVLGKHNYAVSIQYGPSRRRVSYNMQYVNDQFYPSLALAFWDSPEVVQFWSRPGDDLFTWHRSQGFSSQIQLPYITAGNQQGFIFGLEKDTSSFRNWPADSQSPFEGKLLDLFLGWNFSNTHRYPRGISQTDGIELSLGYREYISRLGSDINLSEFSADMEAYYGLPLDRHVVAWKGNIIYNNMDFPSFNPQFRYLAIRSFDEIYVGNLLFTTLEYRFPIFEIKRGWQSIPVFFEQLHGSFFTDFARSISSSESQTAIGGEIRINATYGYMLRFPLRLSFALKIKPEVKPRFVVLIGESF